MTYQELKDRLSKCELTLEKIKNGTYSKSNKDLNQTVEKLTILKESLQKQLAEADQGVVYTDDEKKAKDLADDGVNVKLSDEIDENIEFGVDETKAIARKVGEAVAKALHNLGDEVGHMKAKKIEPNSFEIYIEYKNDNEDEFSFYIKDDTLHLVDFSFDKELTDVGVKPSGEAIVHVDHLANELTKHFKSLNEKVDEKDKPELKKLSKTLSNSVKAHQDQKKALDKAINTEGEVSEAPDDMYYIKVKKTDKASQNALQDAVETFHHPVRFADIVDDDGAGNVIFYIHKKDWNEGMEDDIMGNGVQIVDTNMPLSEADDKVKDGEDTDYAKRRKKESDYHQDKDYYKEEKETDDYGRPHVDPKGSRTFLEPDEMLPHKRFKKMAQKEDTDVGHQDDEPDMLQSTAFETAQYAAKLVKKLQKYDNFDGEVDFPNWWQAKLILAKDYMQKAYHYLAAEEAQPAIDQLALEENVNKIAGGIPFRREGNRFIITEPLDDATKERIMKRAKEHGHHAAPNMAGGVTIMSKEGKVNEAMSPEQKEAIYDLENILDQAAQLGDEARNIVKDHFPNELSAGDAYDVFNFGSSSNSYDKTLETLINDIQRTADEEEDMDEGRKDNDALFPDNSRLPEIKKLADKIVSMVKAEAAKGELGYIKTMEEIRYQQEDDFERTPEWNKAKGIRSDFDDYGSGTNEGVAKTQKALDLVVSKMKELAKLYKAGDKSVIDQLKDLTAKKKKLEAMLDKDVADTGRDQELAEGRGDGAEIFQIINDRAAEDEVSEREAAAEVLIAIAEEYMINLKSLKEENRNEKI